MKGWEQEKRSPHPRNEEMSSDMKTRFKIGNVQTFLRFLRPSHQLKASFIFNTGLHLLKRKKKIGQNPWKFQFENANQTHKNFGIPRLILASNDVSVPLSIFDLGEYKLNYLTPLLSLMLDVSVLDLVVSIRF